MDRCIDCDATEGALHETNCPGEDCPFCGEQLVACGCIKRVLALTPDEAQAVDDYIDDSEEPLLSIIARWERALADKGRVPWKARGRAVAGPILASGEARHAANPKTFQIPPRCVRLQLAPGRQVKLLFETADGGERMWVIIDRRSAGGRYTGRLANHPAVLRDLRQGDTISFGAEHIIDLQPLPKLAIDRRVTVSLSRLLRDPARIPRVVVREPPSDADDSGLRLLDGDEAAGFGGAAGDLARLPLADVAQMYEAVRPLLDDRTPGRWRWDDDAGRYLPPAS